MLSHFPKLTKLILVCGLACGLHAAYAEDKTHLPQPIQQYIANMVQNYQFNQATLTKLFENAKVDQEIIERLTHPAEKMPWSRYRAIFMTPEKINGGVAFWKQYEAILNAAEKKYGIPANIIVAIIGVETDYGKKIGSHPAFSTLMTLAFYHKARADFFRHELTQYLLLTREQDLAPLGLTSSYAGALGIPQFMPSTYRRFAVGYSKEKNADLVHKPEDAILSIANYLKKMGWKTQLPIAYNLNQKHIAHWSPSKFSAPIYSLHKLQQQGIKVPANANLQLKATLINLTENPADADYWLAYHNFYTIMRYNPRIKYAMVVYQLSEAVKNQREKITSQ